MDEFIYNAKRHAYSRTDEYLFAQLIPYIGSKRKLLPVIARALARTGEARVFADLFAGSGVVSRMAKRLGYQVVANDWEPYATVLNGAYVGLNNAPMPVDVFTSLNSLAPVEGFVTKNFCPSNDDFCDPKTERMFYTRENGMKIDAIRSQIAAWEETGIISAAQRCYLLAPLLSAASYVSNTSGVFKAYHAGWGGKTGTALYRIKSALSVLPPPLYDNGLANIVTQADALSVAKHFRQIAGTNCDVAYLDPPYNQHPYGSNYHLLNTIALYDKPEIGKIARGSKSAIRTDWRDGRRSAFNSAATAANALAEIVDAIDARWVLVSYSTDGNISLDTLISLMGERGRLTVETQRYKRYRVSTQRMSQRSHNVEFVLILDKGASPAASDCDRCLAEIREAL